MITGLYRWFGEIFRFLFPPDGSALAYFLNGNIWTEALFTRLFMMVLILSLGVALFYYLYLNGKNMPSIYNEQKHWWNTLLINAGITSIASFIFFWNGQLPYNNHFLCIFIANILYSAILFFIISMMLKRLSNSAPRIPFSLTRLFGSGQD